MEEAGADDGGPDDRSSDSSDSSDDDSVAEGAGSQGKPKRRSRRLEPTYRLPSRVRAILVALHDLDAQHTFGKHLVPVSTSY
jgi:hypothetical protein